MKSTIFALTTFITSLQASTFTTLNVNTLELSATDTANSTASVIDLVANTVTTSYTFTSDYDGQGGDDTLSFDVVATFSGTNDGAQIGNATALNYIIEPGQTITFSIGNLSYARANGLSESVIFNGFYEISVGGAVTGDFSSAATGDTYLGLSGTGVAITLDTYEPLFDLTLDPLAIGSKFFRRPDANFSLENTIPEPSTSLLLTLAMTSMITRRRK